MLASRRVPTRFKKDLLMKKLSTLLVAALVPLFAASLVQSCASGETVPLAGAGSGGGMGDVASALSGAG